LKKLRASFKENDGTVTAGNASSIRSVQCLSTSCDFVPFVVGHVQTSLFVQIVNLIFLLHVMLYFVKVMTTFPLDHDVPPSSQNTGCFSHGH
jgi:hypothetical protein